MSIQLSEMQGTGRVKLYFIFKFSTKSLRMNVHGAKLEHGTMSVKHMTNG